MRKFRWKWNALRRFPLLLRVLFQFQFFEIFRIAGRLRGHFRICINTDDDKRQQNKENNKQPDQRILDGPLLFFLLFSFPAVYFASWRKIAGGKKIVIRFLLCFLQSEKILLFHLFPQFFRLIFMIHAASSHLSSPAGKGSCLPNFIRYVIPRKKSITKCIIIVTRRLPVSKYINPMKKLSKITFINKNGLKR